MAVALVQTRKVEDHTGVGTAIASGNFTVSASGALLIVGVCLKDTGAGNPTVTDARLDPTGANVALATDITRQNASTDSRIYIMSTANVSSGTHAITITRSSAAVALVYFILEVSGAQTTAGYQDGAGASATSSSTNPASGTFTAGAIDDFWVAVFGNEGGADATVAAGAAGPTWVMDSTNGRHVVAPGGDVICGIETSANPGSAGAFNGNFVAATAAWAAAVFAYKAAAGGVTIATPLGSQPHTGRTPLLGFGINMPDVA